MWQYICQEFKNTLDLFLPPMCQLCGHPLSQGFRIAFCHDCLIRHVRSGPAHCRRCAHPHPKASSDHLCQACVQKPPDFSKVYIAGTYQGSIKEAVQALKYRNRLMLAKPLGQLLGKAIEAEAWPLAPECIIPVPLHLHRLKSRGFNQAIEIARPLAKKFGVHLDVNLLERVRATPSQQGLTAVERRRNMQGAFALKRPLPADRILLVDDIMTTGATVRECSRILKNAGAEQIHVAVVGRA